MTAPSLTEAQIADRVAGYAANCGSLDAALDQLRHDACEAKSGYPVHDVYRAALAERSAQRQATETLDERCFRLGLMAAAKDAEAERHMAAEADAAGRAASRRFRWGHDDTLAASFDREAAACLQLALDAQAEAERLRSQARSLRKAQAFAADVIACLHAAQ